MNRLSIFHSVFIFFGERGSKKGRKIIIEGNKFNDPKVYETAAQVVMRDKTHKICKKKRRYFFFHGKILKRKEDSCVKVGDLCDLLDKTPLNIMEYLGVTEQK